MARSFIVASLFFVTITMFHAGSSAQVSKELIFQFCSPFPIMKLEVFIQETGRAKVLTEKSIYKYIEKRLRLFRVLADSDVPTFAPSLKVSVIKHDEAFSAAIAYRRSLRGIETDKWKKVSVWEISRVGTSGDARYIIESLSELANSFLSKFSRVQNSIECGAWKKKVLR